MLLLQTGPAYGHFGSGAVFPINGSFREECLNETLFSLLAEARSQINALKDDYNRNRPHSSLGNLTP
ncbi:transposase [Labrenzia sp. PO1]|nr:transposase [Labrenzia sp. PO1]